MEVGEGDGTDPITGNTDLSLLEELLCQRKGLGQNELLKNPGSSFTNRFQCQTPDSLQVGVLGHLASLGIPRLYQFQYSKVFRR